MNKLNLCKQYINNYQSFHAAAGVFKNDIFKSYEDMIIEMLNNKVILMLLEIMYKNPYKNPWRADFMCMDFNQISCIQRDPGDLTYIDLKSDTWNKVREYFSNFDLKINKTNTWIFFLSHKPLTVSEGEPII